MKPQCKRKPNKELDVKISLIKLCVAAILSGKLPQQFNLENWMPPYVKEVSVSEDLMKQQFIIKAMWLEETIEGGYVKKGIAHALNKELLIKDAIH